MIEVGGWGGLKARIFQQVHSNDYVHLWSTLGTFSGNPMGVHWTGIVFGLGGAIACGYWTTDFLVVQRAMAAKDLRSAQLAPIIASYFKMVVPLIVILPGFWARCSALSSGARKRYAARPAQLQRSAAAHAGALRRAGPAGSRHHRADRRLHVGHGRQRQRLRHRVDLRHLPALHPQGAVRRALRPHRRWCTLIGVFLSIGTAYFVTNFKSIMDYMQALVGFFISPLFGTVLIGMVWKRATPKGGFWGLLAGTGSSVAMYIAVRSTPHGSATWRSRPMPKTWPRTSIARFGRCSFVFSSPLSSVCSPSPRLKSNCPDSPGAPPCSRRTNICPSGNSALLGRRCRHLLRHPAMDVLVGRIVSAGLYLGMTSELAEKCAIWARSIRTRFQSSPNDATLKHEVSGHDFVVPQMQLNERGALAPEGFTA